MTHRGLEAGEGEMRLLAAEHRPGQGKAAGAAGERGLLHRRSAGKAETQELGGLVERLAQGVVDGGAEALVGADAFDDQELGVAAGDQQQQVRRGEVLRQTDGQGMGFEVVDGNEVEVVRKRDGLGRHHADQQAADQPGPAGRGHGIKRGELHAGRAHGLGDDLVEALHMRARRNLRHDAAEAAMRLPLGAHDVGEDAAAAVG